MKLSEELTWRGFINQTTYKDWDILDNHPVTFYWGVDPSADSMQIGNLAAAMMVKTFIKHGHKPVLLVGGATGLIGDPDGKSEERSLQSIDEISRNKENIVAQYHQIFGDKDITVVDNYEWFKDMDYLGFLRDVGKHVPMRQMLSREFVQTRLSEDGAGISYAEFSYVLIQAYDFLHLYEKHGVTLQVCGSDQWGNSIAGVDLIRRKAGGEAHVYSVPLIVNKSTGRKFGKSEEGAVWLDPTKTTPTAFYQFWVNCDDEGAEDYLKVFTELDRPAIEAVMTEQSKDPSRRVAQHKLAEEVTTLVHGEAAAKLASQLTAVLVGSHDVGSLDSRELDALRQEVPAVKAGDKGSIIEALVASGLATSNSEARRLLASNAIAVNGQKVQRENFEKTDFQNNRLLIRRGKAFKDTALVELQ